MIQGVSLEKINGNEVPNATGKRVVCNCQAQVLKRSSQQKRRIKRNSSSILEQYHITIKPKLIKSNSFSDLTSLASEKLNYRKYTRHFISENKQDLIIDSAGDTLEHYWTRHIKAPYMSWNFKGKKLKKKIFMSPKNLHNYQQDTNSSTNNSSMDSIEGLNIQKGAAFPFKETPSGNFKVQSNQVVFQSSTVGVLLADPTQAEVKVKFEGQTDLTEDQTSVEFGPNQYNKKEISHTKYNKNINGSRKHEQKEKDLKSLGYTINDPVDWMRVQLPKKQDLYQEFYRRIHNFVNTDTIVRVGRTEFNCHRLVLQIYSTFFDNNNLTDIEIPIESVTPEAFSLIYEWMILNGQDSNKIINKDNILDIFCAAQYLSVKDLKDQCWSCILNENVFTEDSAFGLFRAARLKGITPVMDLMIPRVMRFFLPLVASNDFLSLEVDEVTTFLKSNYICVTSEIEVLMAGVRWLYGDWNNRKKLAVEVMRSVRFGLISPWQLVDIKRNRENAEILEIVNDTQIQQMVDDGLAYVIIKYWYGNNSKNYYHWIDVLGLTEPAERNWIGEEKNHVTYKEFLKYLDEFTAPKDQMYQQMVMMQPPRRNDEIPGSLRGNSLENDKMDMRRPKMDFPLPAALKGLTGEKDQFSTMADFFAGKEGDTSRKGSPSRSPPPADVLHSSLPEPILSPTVVAKDSLKEQENIQHLHHESHSCLKHPIHVCNCEQIRTGHMYEPPEKDSTDELNTTNSEISTETPVTSVTEFRNTTSEKRHSVAACYLAAATAALSGSTRDAHSPSPRPQMANVSRQEHTGRLLNVPSHETVRSPQTSLFNESKEELARLNMNKLSTSILGPSNKNYITEGSLFNWDRETVLVFGGVDPHTTYGIAGNTGKDINRFDPVTNTWDCVGELPEPRHHHSVAFLRGRVFLVGGSDPREDDLRGKSVVVSTVWSYEPVKRSWYSESGLAIPRKNFGLVVHRMALYAIGGQDKKGRVLRSVEKFDPKSGSWSSVRSMGVARMAAASAKYREYIWVAGGMTGERRRPVSDIVECYNCRTNEWTQIHCLRFPRCFASLFTMNDKLYLVGGAGKISNKDKTPSSVGAIDVWDWKDRQWKLETEMSIPRHGHALAYLGTQAIIIGGVTTIYMRALNNVESFCCERGAWIRGVATLPSPLSGHGAVTLPPASLM